MYEWVEFKSEGQLPPERRYVLVQCAEQPEKGLPPCVAVGYLRIHSGGPFFTTPGISRGEVTHWCDCLGDDFTAPLWPGTHPGASTKRFQESGGTAKV